MNKLYSMLLAFVLAVGMLAGCGAQEEGDEANATQEEAQEVTLQVDVSKNKGEEMLAEEEITVEEGTTLMEVMEDNFEVEQTEGYINSIEGIAGDDKEKMAWIYTINGEDATVGANEYEVEEGDEIVFDYQSWE
ncbi:DUF4430 domain-containing protein [Halobacillus litoralis]|uniref:Transcobalamin-like C-terminal domain-containing protein n=1 Tax=Halobacillus litoralis TaxID=45668 RepID=A0A410M6Z8_9BACI|nr:DUF4430 domain-containing protein [Halobacillus litoralis]QAS50738.1 hypothetical protein HLI_00260 [Halobacillus litoralis]